MILRSELVLLTSLALLGLGAADTDSARPRGVGPEFAKFYKSSTKPATFTCISHPGIIISYDRINDDFCDCPDGSDEPGTAACSYLSPLSPPQPPPGVGQQHIPGLADPNASLALPGFYCKNKGHVPSYLKFESVNDGICDYALCCDGSDEYAGVGGVKCPDKCAEMGREHRKQEEVRNKALRNAMKKKQELLATAKKMKTEVDLKIRDLEAQIIAKEIKVAQSSENLKDIERRERLKVVKGDAAGKGKGKTGVLLGLAKGRVEELRTQLEKTRKHRDSMLGRVGELEGILAALKEERNPNFNDEGVKRAVRLWEDYVVRETDDYWTEAEHRDLEAVLKEDGEESGVNWADFEGADEGSDDTAALYQLMDYLPVSVQLWVNDRISGIRQLLIDNGIIATPGTDGQVAGSKAVQQAKMALADAERDVQNGKNALNDAKSDLEKDYGPSSIFRALKDQCIEKDSGEYIYELCFMKSTTQKPKKGGANTGMGNFVGFETEFVDDEMPLDGKGLGRGDRVVMKYENGQHCWNGPNRSTRVILACHENEEIWKVSESEKCVYRMEVGTPAVCGFKNGDKQGTNSANEGKKDEL